MLAKTLFSQFDPQTLDIKDADFDSPLFLHFIPYEFFGKSENWKALDKWELGCYTMRPVDIAAYMPHISTELFTTILSKARLSSVSTRSDEGLLYWLCLNPHAKQKQAKMRALLKKGPKLLEHNITDLHIKAAMGESRGEQSTGTPDINGLYPYHYAIAARSNNFISWLPPKEEIKTISSGYYQGVSFFWWLACHFCMRVVEYLEGLQHPKLPSLSALDFDSHPIAEKYPERNTSSISFWSDDFFAITEKRPSLLKQINMNAVFRGEDGTTVMNGLLREYASEEDCNWLEKYALQCKTHIDLYGIVDEQKMNEANESCLFQKIAIVGEYELIATLLSHPNYAIGDLITLRDLVQKEKGNTHKTMQYHSEIDYEKINNLITQEIVRRQTKTEEEELKTLDQALPESVSEKVDAHGVFKKQRGEGDKDVSKNDQKINLALSLTL